MSEFLEYCPFDGKMPPQSGAYNIITITRDNVPVISVAYYNAESKQWYREIVSEFGYCEQFSMSDNYISHFKIIEGVEFVVIPENYQITISGVSMEEDKQ